MNEGKMKTCEREKERREKKKKKSEEISLMGAENVDCNVYFFEGRRATLITTFVK